MKPVKLTISGLNSFEAAQTIDFEALSSKGLFGIFGPTGSGKSTIIDGIVMSLYGPGSMPRGTKDFINTECDQAELEFVFRTAVEGVVREIEIRRVFRRSGEGYRSHQSRLVVRSLEGEILQIEDKQGEVNHSIQDILGLSDSEFLKMVVLPQGKFSEFIQLDPRDRRNMLQNLFGLEIYGDRLTERLKKVLGKLQSQRDQLEGQLSAYDGVDQAELEKLKAASAHWDQQASILEKEAQRQKLAYDALSQRLERQKRLQLLREAASRHEAAKETYQEMKNRLERHEKAEDASEVEGDFRLRQKRLEESRSLLEAAAARYAAAREAAAEHAVSFAALEAAFRSLSLTKHEAVLAQNKWHQAKAVNQLKTEKEKTMALAAAQLKRHEAEVLSLAQHDQALATLSEEINGLTALLEEDGLTQEASDAFLTARDNWEKSKEEKAQLERLKTALERAYEGLGQLEKEQELSQATAEATEEQLRTGVKAYEDLTGERDTNLEALEKARVEKLTVSKALGDFRALLTTQEEETKALKALVEEAAQKARVLASKREAYNAALAVRLRSTLRDGDPCPVCGHLYSPGGEALQGEVDSAWLKAFEEEDQALAVMKHQEKQLEASLLKRRTSLEAEGRHHLEAEDAQLEQAIAGLQKARAEAEAKAEAIRKEQVSLQSLLKDQRDKAEKSLTRLAAQRQELAVMVSRRDMILESQRKHEAVVKAYLQSWHGYACEDEMPSETALTDLFDAFGKKKASAELRRKQLQSLQQKRERDNEEKLRQLKSVSESSLEKERLSNALKQTEAELVRLSAEVGNETDEAVLESRYFQLSRKIEETEAAYPREEAAQAALLEAQERLKNEWVSLEATVNANARQLEESRQRFEEKWRTAGFISEAAWREALLDAETVDRLTNWIRDYEVEGRTILEKLEEYQDLYEASMITEEELMATFKASEDAQLNWTQALEARSTAAQALKVMTQSLQQKTGIEKLLSEVKQETGYFEILQKLLRGNRFVEFLAMNQLDYILQEASRRLMVMTANRYRLEVDSRGNFRISDHHQGGVSRDLRSLSGGETFMASLALALAMSSRLQLRGKIRLETFLLDEGFGSLDAALLDVVMHSLETLIGDQLSVGLISHVEALKARVPVRLDVTPAEPGVSGTKVQTVVN
ncbi:AAA family ATPase [Acidaminobacter hydrogenoformans]|uniref:Nuclease SbcCD subunit C n=1 Tax=Acidaminobacter hydrogenoformans DSM 2784 TaxID=1120920 RepID=A0A1G5S3S1_9FIRM|nr:SMC family ATPase [Acidaminobacter hydrogenoformans]SCZ80818.1 exonuclease SbcC [Acidaminobacter hydrogenoformans DSM 2784]